MQSFGEDLMFGPSVRLAMLAEIRGEWANPPFIGNMAQTIQVNIVTNIRT